MTGRPTEIQILEDDGRLDQEAAELITRLAQEAVTARSACHLVLSGGGTPSPVYELLSLPKLREIFPWSQTHVYWGDERLVPAGDSGSNYGQAFRLLLAKVPVPLSNVHRIKGELSPPEAVADYRSQLKSLAGSELDWPIFDIVLLGMGEDGHTASLFPGERHPEEDKSPVMAVQAEYENRPANRVTLTPLVLNDARTILFLVKGNQKAEAVARVLEAKEDAIRWPVLRIRPKSGRVLWLVDKAAGSKL